MIFLSLLKKLLILKNTNYGSSFDKLRDEYGAVSFLIRLKDKLYRYETLATQNIECNEEGLDDTLKDIIGYVTLELIYRKQFLKKREAIPLFFLDKKLNNSV